MCRLPNATARDRSYEDFVGVESFSQKRCAVNGVTVVLDAYRVDTHVPWREFGGEATVNVAGYFDR